MPFMRLSAVPRLRVALCLLLGFWTGIYLFISWTQSDASSTVSYIDKSFHDINLQSNSFKYISTKNETKNETKSVQNQKETVYCSTPLKLMFIILSSPYEVPRREAIRKTWLMFYNKLQRVKINAKFVIGTKGINNDLLVRLNAELNQYRDIVYLQELEDSFHNLTYKLMSSLVWSYNNYKFDFLIKCDSDSFVQIDRLVEALHQMKCPSLLYWGYFNGVGYPEYNGKWSEKQWFICPHYIPYAMGGGYVLSWQIVKLIADLKDQLSLYKNEDVSVGLWLAPFNINRFHDIRFNTEGTSRGCNNNYIISHKEKVATFIQKRKKFMSNRTLCKNEHEFEPAYLYNWNVSPSLCCQSQYGIPVPR